jgi:peptide chain release factor 3
MNWPIGSGRQFTGVYDRLSQQCLVFTKTSVGGAQKAEVIRYSLDSPEMKELIGAEGLAQLNEELELLEIAGNPFQRADFLAGKTTPVFFASALTNFGVEPFFDAFVDLAPSPQARSANRVDGEEILIDPLEAFSAYVFKLQANMDKRHRDSMAFLRVCSGKFERDLVVKHHRSGREVRLSRPHGMVAGERTTLDIGYAGDVIGVINPGVFAVGDSISIKGGFNFKPLPQFQPENFAKVSPKDVGKRKSFDKGVMQLAEEGAIQMLHSMDGDLILAAVGKLQFEVMQYRLKDEYGVETLLNMLPYQCSAWLIGNLTTFQKTTHCSIVKDRWERPMVLFREQWEKQYAVKQNPQHQLVDIVN